MELLIHLILFLVAGLVLTRSATYLIQTITQIAIQFNLSQYTAAFILMAFATSIPELMVSVSSALDGASHLALGLVIGSNIANVSLVIGLPTLMAGGMKMRSKARNSDLTHTTIISLVPIVLLLDGDISRLDGIVLLLLFVVYFYRILHIKQRYHKRLKDGVSKYGKLTNLANFSLQLLFLIVSANYLVKYSEVIALDLKVPLVLIGFIMVAIGTSIPELSFELFAISRHKNDMALGNILGSVVTNSTLVLGVAAIIHPIHIQQTELVQFSAFFWVLLIILFSFLMKSKSMLSSREALVLVFLYGFFVVTILSSSTIQYNIS